MALLFVILGSELESSADFFFARQGFWIIEDLSNLSFFSKKQKKTLIHRIRGTTWSTAEKEAFLNFIRDCILTKNHSGQEITGFDYPLSSTLKKKERSRGIHALDG